MHAMITEPSASPVLADERIDPITAEVIHHKLQAMVEEQAITLKAVSGSPVVAEATDFNCGLYLDDGDIVVMGPQVLFHSGTMSTVIKSIIAHCADNPGIRDGDMFILNDPYRGAIHQPDVSIVAPVFHEGKRIAWVGACAHQLDMGGMSFGSWAYQATEIQQEAILLPGLKIVEGGEVRQDIWQMIMRMSRLPQVIGLDFKAMIAANNVARRRFDELMQRYGADTVVRVMCGELDRSEQQMRARLRSLPDGIYRARDYLDHDGHENRLYPVCVTVEKRGDALIVDMAGTAPQAPGFINCTWSGMRGAVFTGLLPILAPDIRWNEGLMRAVTLKAEPGTLCNATFPAPVSGGTVSAAWVVSNVTVAAMSRLVGCSPAWCVEGQAVTKGQFSVLTLAGRDRDGGPFGTFFMDSMAGGGGAFIDHDGLDGSGDYSVPRPVIANVEANEAGGPILYLHRSFIPDTGGAGRHRGGNTVGLAITPHDADMLHAMMLGHGVESPNSLGLFGGLPGGCASHLKAKPVQGDIRSLLACLWTPEAFAQQAGQLGAKPGSMPLHAAEVLGYAFQGGGGYGDPLARDPDKVAQDVRQHMVSTEQAHRLYGVVLRSDGAVDLDATAQLRAQLRHARIGTAPRRPAPDWREGELPELRLFAGRAIACHCGKHLAGPGGNWKDAAIVRELSCAEVGVYLRLHADLILRQYVCPDCATSLEIEVLRRDEAPLVTLELFA